MYRSKLRKRRGHSIAELGPAIFMVLLIMIFPMACLASLGMRYTLMFYAVRDAAREASRSTQFITDASAYQKSAKNRALQVVNLFSNGTGANGLKLVSCNTYAHVINIGTGAITRYGPAAPIPAGIPIDPINNVYNITVQVQALIEPLFEGGWGWTGYRSGAGIPGLTAPFPVTITCASMCEKPQGLHN